MEAVERDTEVSGGDYAALVRMVTGEILELAWAATIGAGFVVLGGGFFGETIRHTASG